MDRPNAILSLTGHNSEIESVCFDREEEYVAAGAVNGSVKVWDLMEAKVVRSLAGHRANAISVDFHPYGEFCASGSLDTNLKIWDIRRKGCIHTYKVNLRSLWLSDGCIISLCLLVVGIDQLVIDYAGSYDGGECCAV